MTVPPRPRAALENRLDVETPELVQVTYTIAGVGSRARAAMLDHAIMVGLIIAAIIFWTALSVASKAARDLLAAPWIGGVMLIVVTLGYWGYFVFFEAIWDGQTPGKRANRLRVVREGGYSVTFGASATRNLLRIVDMQPGFLYAVAVLGAAFSERGRRLGDIVAGTLVVQEDLGAIPAVPASRAPRPGEGPAAPALHAALTDEEFDLLDGFIARQRELADDRRAAFVAQFLARFAEPLRTLDGTTPMARLIRLRDAERAARDRGLAARDDTGAARERHAIVAQGSARWSAFASTLAAAQKGGLARLGEARVRDFVRDYRELAADLARLRTATRGQDAADVFYLNRLVAGAHNLVYRRRALPLRTIARFCFADVPAEIRRSSRVILLAGFLMYFPMAISWVAVVREPAVAATLLPTSMLDRAEDGIRRAMEGTGYIPDPEIMRPTMAGWIIANNVKVAIAAFALGVSAGVGTLWILVSNGISIGAVFGLYASKDILPLLMAFVAPHGVLELTAITLAGGGGLLVAGVLLIPGERSRRTAFRADAPRALRLFAGSAILLLVAGSIEGLISPIPYWPLELKLAVSALTGVLLYLYVRLGAPPVTARAGAVAPLPATAPRAP
ncbi:MAG: stage II sporulation protein M [Gemmatimonadetes bacterium]|nr:stage II sporulation protein M [Gemmatimonadota bacterium]